ncbi:MAG: serine/threonine protein kinase, partial [Planctomycetales bacterium]|nr:serine/threonine protein kinase [Planctomycetales bacterium]
VALKMLPEDRWTNPDVIVRFEREMEAIGQLDHPHIVRASDAGEDNGLHYLVMEYVDGMDLARMVRRLGALPIPEACELIRQAAVGLEYAHEHGLIHRDIKPSNLMLGWQAKDGAKKSSPPTVKVLDMGLALLGDEHFQHEHELTTIGQLMGTLDYMSPEQGMDSHDVTATSDIFSLGATLFKLLTGKSPLDAMNVTTPLRKITTLATKDLPSIAEQRTDLPPELVQLVDRMLAREPQHRISSASAVASQLERFTKNADLSKLLRNAVQANSGEPVSVNQKRIGLPNAESARAVGDNSGRRKFPWRIAVGFAGFLILAATVFRLSTDYGQLIVETDADDVTVEVRQGERVVDTIEVAAGQASGETTVRSGKYELVLAGAGEELRLDANSVSIRRNDVETVRVTKVGSQEADQVAKTLVSNRTSPKQPTYDGRTYAEWLTELKTEKKAERMMDATKALLTLGSTDQSEEAAKAIIQIMRTHGSIVEDGSSQGKLIGFVREELQKMPADAFWAAVKEELQYGNHRSREFLGWFFLANSRLISEHSDEIANLLLQELSEPQSHWA